MTQTLNPSAIQRQASDPAASVWVGASAGTGKTKVLTDRVLGLLLTGTRPEAILCLTFTKAAAAEMSTRIARRLGLWSTLPEAALIEELRDLLGQVPTAQRLALARTLFAKVLETPGGMHIETIHAFCQSLLRRFPLEANIAPHFTIMDDRDAQELLVIARDRVLERARRDTDSHLAQALSTVTAHVHETNFPELLDDLSRDRGRLRRLIARHGTIDRLIERTYALLSLEGTETSEGLLRRACEDDRFDGMGLRLVVQSLQGGSKTDQQKAEALAPWLAGNLAERLSLFSAYRAVFLTEKGDVRKTLATKKVAEIAGVLDIMEEEAGRLVRLDQKLKAATTAEATAGLLRLGDALLSAYQGLKERRALLDYDDLILNARALLNRDGIAPWVLYKLDGGIDHILIDEAQDTNPDQWAVVEALAEEFFSGQGTRDGDSDRTIFAVGDAKQSIYSFQRADPEAFERMRALFAARVPAALGDWREVDLQISFRSTPAVLDAVDAVFASDDAKQGVALDGKPVHHDAFRQGQAGLVELWPPVDPRSVDAPEAWKPPVEQIRPDSPRTRLAKLMARRICDLVTKPEFLESRGRPVQPGDIMVLVRRRSAFVEELVRALKSLNVPVAGVDRMVLTDQISVMDLIALGHFLLLPEDDLTLACVLKSPLFDFDETTLFKLAFDRPSTLWDALRAKRSTHPDFNRAYQILSELLKRVDFMAPFELFSHILGALKGRLLMQARLGPEAEDPLQEFLDLTQKFEASHPPSLEGFLHWLESGAVEIKRDLEQGDGQAVRIMTVHGAKGLQAPIVFLPDTLQMPNKGPRLLWPKDEDGAETLLWPPKRDFHESVCDAEWTRQNRKRDEEYRRLLYVALTRAEDRLYICGWETSRRAPDDCWYNLIKRGLAPFAESVEDPFLKRMAETHNAELLRHRSAQHVKARHEERIDFDAAELSPLPAWALSRAPNEPSPPRPLAPSRPGDEPPAASPLRGGGVDRYRRGRLVHRLLQTLPDMEPENRREAALRWLEKRAPDIDVDHRTALVTEVLLVIDHADFGDLFGPGSRAEAPLTGLIGGFAVSGQVDRLLVAKDRILAVDFKTNRPPPENVNDVPTIYVTQMAAYRLLLERIYPGRPISCALLWTDGPRLMALPEEVLLSVNLDGRP